MASEWRHIATEGLAMKAISKLSLSIKGVPAPWVDALKRRAARSQRSLQGELMVLIEQAVALESLRSPASAAPVRSGEAAAAREASFWPAQPAGARHVAGDSVGAAASRAATGLLATLDDLVAGSQLGHAPVLTREQAHDRRLAREFEYDART
jgi:plasmid stability protein